MKFSEIANNHFRPFATRYPNQIGTHMMVSYLKRSQASDDRPECLDTKMIFKPRKFRILKTLINMKFYLAIAFALLMATAYGIRIKQTTTDDTTAVTTTDDTVVDNTTAATNSSDTNTCESYPYEYDNGSVTCTSISTQCDDGAGTSTSEYEDKCGEESNYTSTCNNAYDPVDWNWSSGDCNSTSCYGGGCSDCTNNYYSNWSEESGSSYFNNECVNGDGSSDCKLLAYIFSFFVYLL
jgi:hypothetical protein